MVLKLKWLYVYTIYNNIKIMSSLPMQSNYVTHDDVVLEEEEINFYLHFILHNL